MINDFIQYWAAARVYSAGGNPYSPVELLTIEQQAGWPEAVPLLMWNPPWTLPLILPLGWLDYDNARLAWFMAHALAVMLGARALWKIFNGRSHKFHYAWGAVLSFAPVYFVLMFGQIGPLVLLGLVGFLFFSRKEHWGWAGSSLAIAAIKPHLVYLLWPGLLLWLGSKARARCVFSLLCGGIVAAVLPLFFNPLIYAHYLALIHNGDVVGLNDWRTPTLGIALAKLFPGPDFWVRWLPSVLGMVWLVWYWTRRAAAWNWIPELPLLIVVSAATTGFAWTYDHVILLPAVIQCAVWTSEMEKKLRRGIIAIHAALAGILLGSKILLDTDLLSIWYFWTAPAFLLFYVYVRWAAARPSQQVTLNEIPLLELAHHDIKRHS